jgi:NAD(P)-dependent dehydrogenase (short-subunit alcohol dehydrogenase family)
MIRRPRQAERKRVMTEVAQVPVPTYPDLAGKAAVVTGGSRGIGVATCGLLTTLFLASDTASWVTGITLDVAGGRVMA